MASRKGSADLVPAPEADHEPEGDTRRAERMAQLSNDLRNPLNAIVCAATLLESSEVAPTVATEVAVILRQAKKLARVLDGALGQGAVAAPRIGESRLRSGVIPIRLHDARQRTVVVVEDDEDACIMLEGCLRRAGWDVASANNGLHGLQLIDERAPSVAILDIGLPGLSGYDIATRVRSTPGRAPIRLIALTALGSASDRAAAFEAGFDEHLTKPLNIAKLRAALGDADADADAIPGGS